ncbi:YceI family protein [Flavobacterium rakeshii]|uniref:Lipid-binding protein n=1 Tax=Flavobacterium beibuense F44-8 TaxID=1406840 RepID=A0A0A2LYH2_9FLAO|nr:MULTISPECIES: YceI family protein [Flavobacterium]KGO84401.1 lipid-binding protein [Flavobacterium beibuense F44-8]MEE1897048.1 YceI family protein [Flavobacterium rakeshii]
MKNKFTLLMLCASLALTVSCKKDNTENAETTEAVEAKEATAEAVKYNVNTEESVIDWTGSKPTGKHTGTIKISEGEFAVKNDSVESGKFTLDMNSITVTDLEAGNGKEDLEGHLKGLGKEETADHFFNVNKYPTGTFEITGITQEEGKTMVEGNLTLKETTKNIKFPATITVTPEAVTLVSESFKIDRTLWKVNYSSKSIFDNLGDKYVDDEIEIKVNVKAAK